LATRFGRALRIPLSFFKGLRTVCSASHHASRVAEDVTKLFQGAANRLFGFPLRKPHYGRCDEAFSRGCDGQPEPISSESVAEFVPQGGDWGSGGWGGRRGTFGCFFGGGRGDRVSNDTDRPLEAERRAADVGGGLQRQLDLFCRIPFRFRDGFGNGDALGQPFGDDPQRLGESVLAGDLDGDLDRLSRDAPELLVG
jgi:hypothetical protein